METKLLKTTQLLVFIYVIFFFAGCSKNTIILEVGDENKPSGGNNTEGTNLVTFNASIEGRNLMTRAMSPMNQGIKSKVLVFEPSTQNGTKGTPSAQGLYITSAPGVLTGVDGYKMYLGNGIFDFYAVSDNFSTIPPTFSAGKSEPLFNGIDYLWWHNSNLDVASSQINIPIVYLHAATQQINFSNDHSAGTGSKHGFGNGNHTSGNYIRQTGQNGYKWFSGSVYHAPAGNIRTDVFDFGGNGKRRKCITNLHR